MPRHCFDSTPGFRIWDKEATKRDAGFSVHAKSEQHKCAMIAWRDYQRAVKTEEKNKKSRAYIKTSGEVLLLIATQNMQSG